MFAVVNQLHFSKPVEEFRKAVEETGLSLLASFPGFQNFYFVRVNEYDAIVIIIWDSAENARNGSQKFGPTWFATNFAPYLTSASDQRRSVGEVIVPYQP
jgi:hypothetical protein